MDGRMLGSLLGIEEHLGEALLLLKSKLLEPLLLYLAVSKEAVRAVLVREEETRQLLVYYISKALLLVEARCPDIEKLALFFITGSRKLRSYF